MKEKTEGVQKIWDRYKYAILVALIGAGLLLWPGEGLWGFFGERPEALPKEETGAAEVQTIQREMESIRGAMKIGRAHV